MGSIHPRIDKNLLSYNTVYEFLSILQSNSAEFRSDSSLFDLASHSGRPIDVKLLGFQGSWLFWLGQGFFVDPRFTFRFEILKRLKLDEMKLN